MKDFLQGSYLLQYCSKRCFRRIPGVRGLENGWMGGGFIWRSSRGGPVMCSSNRLNRGMASSARVVRVRVG